MAALPLEIRGTLYDLQARTARQVLLVGEGSRTDVGIGGGPMPPQEPVDPGWGVSEGHPEHPIYRPPHIWGPTDPRPTPPIFIPPNVPPAMQPPNPPSPGSPTTPVPPPAGSDGWPVQPITPPPYMIVTYPGIGPVYVTPPLTAQPKR